MWIPVTPYGGSTLLLFGGVSAAGVAACVLLGVPWLAPVPAFVLLATLAFFRDPPRRIPDEPGVVVAPADGKIVAVTELEREEFIDGPAVRIDIFLAVYNVHVNRAPLPGTVRSVVHRSGPSINALDLAAGDKNEARCIGFEADEGGFRFVVRQIVGAIARRIVTGVSPGDHLGRGQRFGMLKFGSRTQLSIPKGAGLTLAVKVGDRVRGGSSVLGRVGPGGGR